ncbi:MAG: hypothetical protein IKB07_08230 [Lachnospiraceae bacterium]|nr:hypothetical protein [Lachnospiraceae bacterium]
MKVLFDRKRIEVREVKMLEATTGYHHSLYTDGTAYYVTNSEGSEEVTSFGNYESEEQAIAEFEEYVQNVGASTLYYVRTNGYDMMVLKNNETEECWYVTGTLGNEALFPVIANEAEAEKHLELFAEENDFSDICAAWENDLLYDRLFENVEILAQKKVYW